VQDSTPSGRPLFHALRFFRCFGVAPSTLPVYEGMFDDVLSWKDVFPALSSNGLSVLY